jgi:phosphoserine/homoserine phosphotransferase
MAVRALRSCNFDVFAAGDSFNDLAMIEEAGAGCLFRAPEAIAEKYPHIPRAEDYGALMERIDAFLDRG